MKEKIIEAISGPLSEIDLKVYDVSFEKEDGVDTLFIKLDGFIDTDKAVEATNIISPIIDELNIIDSEYVLDVCSKGEDDE